jgi:hypothetical protein
MTGWKVSVLATSLLLSVTTVRTQPQAPAQTPLQRLEASILRTTRSINATWGIYVKSIESGEEVAIDADRQMETMSTIKIPLMVEVLQQVKAGTLKLTDKYTFAQADSQPGTGTIQRLDPGAVMTVKDLITMMIIVSDNTATEVLFRMVGGPDAVNARMDALGLGKTRAATVPSRWFPALRAAPTTEQFYRDGKHPVRPLDAARDGPAARDDGARHAGRQALVRADAAHHARTALSHAHPALRHRLHHPAQDRRLSPLRRRRCRHARGAGQGRSSSASSPAITSARANCSRTRSAWSQGTSRTTSLIRP